MTPPRDARGRFIPADTHDALHQEVVQRVEAVAGTVQRHEDVLGEITRTLQTVAMSAQRTADKMASHEQMHEHDEKRAFPIQSIVAGLLQGLIMAGLFILALPCAAQVSLTVTKSGSDVVLTATGGSGTYTVIRSAHPSMTERTVEVAKGVSSPVTDMGGKTRGNRIEYYQVSDDASSPSVSVATPAASFSATAPCICATGTATGATVVYCNTIAATGTTSWTACPDNTGVPLAVQADPKQSGLIVVTASAVDANGNWSVFSTTGNYTGTITDQFACKTRGLGQ